MRVSPAICLGNLVSKPNSVQLPRRQFLQRSAGITAGALFGMPLISQASIQRQPFGSGELLVVSDGQLRLPTQMVMHESIDANVIDEFFKTNNISNETLTPDCNIVLWQQGNRLVLFDVGAGPNFMPSAGDLLANLEDASIDPADVTDVIFTHAHPDHIWGLVDDFDELAFPNANYFINAQEWDYWRNENTLSNTPEARKSFVVGAQNRFAYLEDQIQLFQYGDEILPGIEAVNTQGHTPGHTSMALHQANDSLVLLGDAITHPIISFEKPNWLSGSDQDAEQGRQTRLALLDRLASENSQILGYHLPYPGLGRVERNGNNYRYVV